MKVKRFVSLKVSKIILIFLTWLLVVCFYQTPKVNSPQSDELRGVWMTNYGVSLSYHTTRLDEVVANIASHHLNTIYPAVWNRGYTLYPSKITKTNPLLTLPFEDILKHLIYQAHRQNIKLIPWFEYGLMIPTTSAFVNQHPDWITTTKDGKTIDENTKQGWLNPFHPEVQKFFIDLIVDVVQRYSVDGIQLDDHFGLPINFGYDDYTIKLYREQHNGNMPPNNPSDKEWVAWRANKITQFMSQLVKEVRGIKPNLVISLSPNLPNYSYYNYLQDWTRWIQLGLLDQVVVQVYRPTEKLKDELKSLQSFSQTNCISIGLYTGPFYNPAPIEQILSQVKIIRDTGFKGVSFFCWETTLWLFKRSSSVNVKQVFQKLFI